MCMTLIKRCFVTKGVHFGLVWLTKNYFLPTTFIPIGGREMSRFYALRFELEGKYDSYFPP